MLAEVRPMPWSDRRYTGVSTAPMEMLTGDTVGGVLRCEPLTFTMYLQPVTSLSDTLPEAAALSARQLTEAPSAGSGSRL
jgi:hypothetical protein